MVKEVDHSTLRDVVISHILSKSNDFEAVFRPPGFVISYIDQLLCFCLDNVRNFLLRMSVSKKAFLGHETLAKLPQKAQKQK